MVSDYEGVTTMRRGLSKKTADTWKTGTRVLLTGSYVDQYGSSYFLTRGSLFPPVMREGVTYIGHYAIVGVRRY